MSTLSVWERPVFRLPPCIYLWFWIQRKRSECLQLQSVKSIMVRVWYMYFKYVHFEQSCVLAYTTLFYICIYDIYYSIDTTINCSLVCGKTLLPRLKRNAHFACINCSNCPFSDFSLPHVGYLSIWPLISNIVNHLLNELYQTLY